MGARPTQGGKRYGSVVIQQKLAAMLLDKREQLVARLRLEAELAPAFKERELEARQRHRPFAQAAVQIEQEKFGREVIQAAVDSFPKLGHFGTHSR